MKKFYLTLLMLTVLGLNIFAQPVKPTGLSAEVRYWHSIPFVALSWNASNHMSSSFILYRFNKDANDSLIVKKIHIPFFMNKFKDFKVKTGLTYNYYLIAYNTQGLSDPSDTVSVTIDSLRKSALFYGAVSDTNNIPINNASVVIIPRMGMFPERIKTDSLGNYSVKLTPGKYYVAFMKRGFFPTFYNNKKSIFNADVITLNDGDSLEVNAHLRTLFKKQYFTVEGRVSDSLGNPIKAKVKSLSLKGRFFTRISPPAVTDSSGHFKLKIARNDSVLIFAKAFNKDFAPEFYNNKRDFADADPILVNGNITGIDFTLQTKKPFNTLVSGKLTDENGNYLTGVVNLFKFKNFRRGIADKRTALTDSLGNFEFKNIPPGNYIAFAVSRGKYKPTFFRYDNQQTFRLREADTIVVKENDPVKNIDFVLYSIPDSGFASIAGVVTDEDGNKVQGAMAFAVNQNNMVISFSATNANGNYNLSELPPGTYNIYFEKAGYSEGAAQNINVDYANNLAVTTNATIQNEDVTGVKSDFNTKPDRFSLFQNYPNPFNPTTIIKYFVPHKSFVKVAVYNIIGQKIVTLVNGVKSAGEHSITFNANRLPSGIYFYTLSSGSLTLTKRMVLIK